MRMRTTVRVAFVGVAIIIATLGLQALRTEAAAGGRHCPRGIKSCSASQVGQPCNPNSPSVICSAQANGSYCCLAYAP